MVITCWGSRGSIPVSGKEYLKYGGDTTCVEIQTKENEVIIVDAGTGIRNLGTELLRRKQRTYHIIFTHAHWDHLMGFPFFKPLYVEGVTVDLYGCPFAQASVKDLLSKSMSPPYFPVKLEDLKAHITYHGICEGPFQIHSAHVTPILLSHPNQGMGYKFVEDGKSFVFLTDNELTYKHPGGLEYRDYMEFSVGADLLIHDAEYTREDYRSTRGWGHSVYNDALRLALEANVKQFGLFHHNQERSDTAMDEIVQDCKHAVKEQNSKLQCFAVAQGMQIRL
jgi:phosphoribosyl 1,2-cyclic phosphodiesterase